MHGALGRPEVDHVDDLDRPGRGECEPGRLEAAEHDGHECERSEQNVQLQQDVQHDVGQHVDGEQQHAARDDADELAAASGAAVAAAESVASAIAEPLPLALPLARRSPPSLTSIPLVPGKHHA